MNSNTSRIRLGFVMIAVAARLAAEAASPVISNIALVPRLTIASDTGVINQIQYSTNLAQTNWLTLTNLTVTQSPYWFVDLVPVASAQFYRVVSIAVTNVSEPGLVPSGAFTMGDTLDLESDAVPAHSVTVSAFHMDTNLVTYSQWQDVYQWAINHSYTFDAPGAGKAANHPVQQVNWFDAVKWCNARSEMQGFTPCYYTSTAQTTVYRSGDLNLANTFVNWSANGYRLPTEAEWEKTARGGVSGHRYPWSDADTINQTRANYFADPTNVVYDVNSTTGYTASFNDGVLPYTSPVGSFAANSYGLFDMAGNVYEWCWDWYDAAWYSNAATPQNDPRGPASSSAAAKVLRGGSWYDFAEYARCAYRAYLTPNSVFSNIGLRCVRVY